MKAHDIADRAATGAMLAVLLVWSSSVPAAEFDRARELYENHCRSCHETWAHTRDGRVVASYDELRARVASWGIHSGLNWGTDEIDQVTAYLNRRFYQLTP